MKVLKQIVQSLVAEIKEMRLDRNLAKDSGIPLLKQNIFSEFYLKSLSGADWI